jgi:hypothetical protein
MRTSDWMCCCDGSTPIGLKHNSVRKSGGDCLEQTELLSFVAAAFERRGLTYAVTGSHASIAYGEYRFTNDIDIVVDLAPTQLSALLSEFPANDFYVSEDGAKYAVLHGGQFNIIHQDTHQKVDVIVPKDANWPDQLARRIRLPTDDDREVWFIAPEDLILRKMHFYREGESDKHLRDIAGIIKIRGDQLDFAYVDEWANRLELLDIWHEVLRRIGRM